MDNIALYIHWPFCKAKCPYCDFNSHVASDYKFEEWGKAYIKELNYFKKYLKDKVITSIFFGGGTPSLMSPLLVESLIAYIKKTFKTAMKLEITLEANPTSYEAAKFSEFKKAGINRVSLGVQALNDADLKFLGREHSSKEAIKAIESAAQIFNNFNFDLIYARPGQTLEKWEKELKLALSFNTKHLSLYQLTIEKGTKFYTQHKNGEFVMPEEELKDNLYLLSEELCEKKELYNYEISNYAKSGFKCEHNLNYWRYNEYLGIGPGAHSRVMLDHKMSGIIMQHQPENWLKSVSEKNNGIQSQTLIEPTELLIEILMMRLRIDEKIEYSALERFNITYKEIIPKLEKLNDEGLIISFNDGFKSTQKGRKVLNSLLKYLCF
ncbi:radical SAM family heme chaperone HemW [Rickettsiales endosymbiont of Stachyamoeba lipophora]|uniref:radical SAM family heme chaperone HemW n=1 Tax=Rickettsiales endosymbiont of Stachyamoeba lipophora TaxID=2486578 RepID=UPI000F6555D5|nr:radical SAM family heme chaperone HemW [Rickettsiales endosymbiont of Stachyamoeba lipophora]AZL14985.1 coproporphyrinogen III oxidase [Rickettsiales endosymbiont of Stachyamoeba lipophora]